MVDELEFYLAKLQTTKGVKETLSETDYIQISKESTIDKVPSTDSVECASGTLDQEPKVQSTANVDVKAIAHLSSFGILKTPPIVTLLQAGGFDLTDTEISAGKHKFVLNPGNTPKDISISKYELESASKAKLLEAHSIVFAGGKISLEPGKVPKCELSGKGCFSNESVVETIPEIVRSRYQPNVCLPLVSSLLGVNYRMTKFDFDFQMTAEQLIDWSDQYGFGSSEASGKEYKWSGTFYQDLALASPFTTLRNGTIGNLSATWGPTGLKCKISSANAQITNVKNSKVGKIRAYDVEGIFTGNQVTISINDDATA